MFKTYANLTKIGIVIFVLLSGVAGYATGFQSQFVFDWLHFGYAIGGLYFLSSGSLALNQAQEWKLDKKMKRTEKRPIASGKLTPTAGYVLAAFYIWAGLHMLFQTTVTAGIIGIISVVLYNGVYTYIWKPKWVYGAVPGAIPGALPVTIGYAAINENIFNPESVYLFLVLFLWQMPHFWALAIRFKDDYASGNIPTLPVAMGVEKTLYQIGLYTFVYVGVALASPWFFNSSWFYILLVVPFSFKVLQEFYRFYKSNGTERWFAFFMWTNFSVLVYMFVPVIDKWNFLFIKSN